jgi:hypothetical protein
MCAACDMIELQQPLPAKCPCCGSSKTHALDIKQELARLAELAGCGVEIVHDSDSLMRLGGVGCLLRFLSQETYCSAAACEV